MGPVPISFTNFAIYITLYVLGWKRGTVSYLVYVLIGMVGMPVFSGYSGGLAKLAGPTGGYIVGFIPMAVIAGLVIDKFRNRGVQLAGMIGATALCYAFGTAWFCFQAESDLLPALTMCVFPFIPRDLVKMVVAIAVGPMLRNRLKKAGLQPEDKIKIGQEPPKRLLFLEKRFKLKRLGRCQKLFPPRNKTSGLCIT